MSHATLCKLHGIDWREDYRVAKYNKVQRGMLISFLLTQGVALYKQAPSNTIFINEICHQ